MTDQLGHRATIRHGERQRLGQVDVAAAAPGDQVIHRSPALLAHPGRGAVAQRCRRVGFAAIEDQRIDALAAQCDEQLPQRVAMLRKPSVRDDQSAVPALAVAQRRDARARAVSAQHARRRAQGDWVVGIKGHDGCALRARLQQH